MKKNNQIIYLLVEIYTHCNHSHLVTLQGLCWVWRSGKIHHFHGRVWKFYKIGLKSPEKSGKIFPTILVEIFDVIF